MLLPIKCCSLAFVTLELHYFHEGHEYITKLFLWHVSYLLLHKNLLMWLTIDDNSITAFDTIINRYRIMNAPFSDTKQVLLHIKISKFDNQISMFPFLWVLSINTFGQKFHIFQHFGVRIIGFTVVRVGISWPIKSLKILEERP